MSEHVVDDPHFGRRTIDWSFGIWYPYGPAEHEARTEFARQIREQHGVDVPLAHIPLSVDTREVQIRPARDVAVRRKGWLARLFLGEYEMVWVPATTRMDHMYVSTGSFTWVEAPKLVAAFRATP